MAEINWTLIQNLAEKPHRHLNLAANGIYGVMLADGTFDTGSGGVGEVMQEARTVQHLLDIVGIPEGKVYDAHIDARAAGAHHPHCPGCLALFNVDAIDPAPAGGHR